MSQNKTILGLQVQSQNSKRTHSVNTEFGEICGKFQASYPYQLGKDMLGWRENWVDQRRK